MTEVIFWAALVLLVYTILGYPLLLLMLAPFFGRIPKPTMAAPKSFTFLIAAHNEEACIRDKLLNTLGLDDPGGFTLQIIVVSDGSTDGTVREIQSVEDRRVEFVATRERTGKALALNKILPMATGEVVMFTDANSFVSAGALAAMADQFRDPAIGGVCGQIEVDTSRQGAIGKGEGLYWRYDQALKRAEARLGGAVSAQGSFYGIRREFTGPVRPDCTDDFFNSVRVVAQGSRLAFEPGARATEHVTEKASQEMGRRIRSTEQGWRAMFVFWQLMNPLRYGFYAWQFISHKFLRRLTPLFLVILFASNMLLLGDGGLYLALGLVQLAAYGLVLIAAVNPAIRRAPVIRHLFFFAMSNVAMALGFFRFATGTKSTIWNPVRG